MHNADFDKIKETLPQGPGIYKFLDEDHTILYVGKAKNLKKRVSSYFLGRRNQAYKTKVMVKHAKQIDCVLVETESDALLLENTLIKKYQPRYNVHLKDAKSYTYICVKNERFPRVFFTRRIIQDGSQYFGPYTSKHKARIVLEMIKSLFPIRSCTYNLSQENIDKGKFKVCLEYHIKNCEGPCVGLETEDLYNEKILQIRNMLKGQFGLVKNYWKSQMERFVEDLEYEKAHAIKEKLEAFEDYQGKSTVVSTRIKNVDVFSILQDDKIALVNYIRVVNGAIIYTNTVELTKNLNVDGKHLLVFAIHNLREKYNSNAPEILVPYPVELYDDALEVIVPKIGDKKKLLDLSQKNLTYYNLQRKKDEMLKKTASGKC